MKTNNFKTQIGTIFIVMIIPILSACKDKPSMYDDSSLNLVGPVEIISWSSFADGGSIEITLKDSKEKSLTFYYDLSGEGSKKNRPIYIGNLTPDHKNSKQVPIGSPVEKEIVEYVSKWMTSNFPDYQNHPEQIYQHSDGKLLASASVIGLIADLKERAP